MATNLLPCRNSPGATAFLYFQHSRKKYLPHREADLSLFNANEIKVIDDVLQKLSDMNASTISEYSHQDVPWVVTLDREKIDYESVFYRTSAYSLDF